MKSRNLRAVSFDEPVEAAVVEEMHQLFVLDAEMDDLAYSQLKGYFVLRGRESGILFTEVLPQWELQQNDYPLDIGDEM